jgi:pimeloyl-ACP methyl ester carboxylesterase
VLGHSLGGWIAASLALHAPRRVDHLILNDAAGIDRGATTLPVDLAVSTRRNMRRVFEAMFHDAGFVTDDVVDYAYRLHLERGDHYAIKSVLETLGSPDEKVDGQLARLDVPTLLLWGDHDAITPLAMAHAFQQGIRGARLQSIADCGHVPCLEKPAQFVDAVEAFLR